MQINAARINQRLTYLSQFGATPEGGVKRPALSQEEQAATAAVARWMEEAGLQVRQDAAGNLFGRLLGRRQGPPVLSGSHLDSVPSGGNYDGPAGVLGALEAVESMREQGLVPELPVEVVSFIGEEGSRFPHGLLGSSFVAGTFAYAQAASLKDRDGIALPDALRNYSANPDALRTAAVAPGAYAAYVEMHIEQSGVLEARDLPVGIVSGIAGMHQWKGIIRGRAEHAGACPMDLRRDPLPAAAAIVLEAERAARESGPTTRATVGFIKATPGAANVIPASVELTFDVRDLDAARRDACNARIEAYFRAVCAERGLSAETGLEQHSAPPTVCDPAVIGASDAAALALGLQPFVLPSGAVHDTANMAAICPVGMIFLRSRDGLSHCPQEYTSPEDVAVGTQLLADTLWRLANP